MHIVSTVHRPRSPTGVDAFDVLRRLLPGRHADRRAEGAGDGDHRRAGAGPPRASTAGRSATSTSAGDLDMAIAIRTAVMRDGTAYVQASAGIVADSIPAAEEQETRNKARAVLQAIATAETLRRRRRARDARLRPAVAATRRCDAWTLGGGRRSACAVGGGAGPVRRSARTWADGRRAAGAGHCRTTSLDVTGRDAGSRAVDRARGGRRWPAWSALLATRGWRAGSSVRCWSSPRVWAGRAACTRAHPEAAPGAARGPSRASSDAGRSAGDRRGAPATAHPRLAAARRSPAALLIASARPGRRCPVATAPRPTMSGRGHARLWPRRPRHRPDGGSDAGRHGDAPDRRPTDPTGAWRTR